jgi:fumarylacetoacetate (FAA) hydrolase
VTQINDVSLRERIKRELPKQFGFLQSKPPSSAGPLAITPDELGSAWNMGTPELTMSIQRGDVRLGELETGELHFSFGALIAHAASTHALSAGTVIGTGTVSNSDEGRGVACVAEQVALDITAGRPPTPYFGPGEHVSIETFLRGHSLFGRILNRFVRT